MGKLDGKVCIITGCSTGLGKQHAIRFAAEGAKLAICARNMEKLKITEQLCREKGAEVLAIQCDVSKMEDLENFVNKTIERYGTIDVLLNNAHNTTMLGPFLAKPEEDLISEFECGLLAYWRLMKLCYPYMKGHPGAGASIINTASKAGIEGSANHAAYASIKEGIRALTRVVAHEWGIDNIRVNAVCPSGVTEGVREDLHNQPPEVQEWVKFAIRDNAFNKEGDPYEDVSPIFVFLASDDSHWMTGDSLRVDGGHYMTA